MQGSVSNGRLRFLSVIIARAKLSELIEGVDSCRMSIAPLDVDSVTSNVTDLEGLDISRDG